MALTAGEVNAGITSTSGGFTDTRPSSRLRGDAGKMSRCPSCPREISRARFEHEREGDDRQRGEGMMKKPIMPYTAIYYQSLIGLHRVDFTSFGYLSVSLQFPDATSRNPGHLIVSQRTNPRNPFRICPSLPSNAKDPLPNQTNSRHPLPPRVASPPHLPLPPVAPPGGSMA